MDDEHWIRSLLAQILEGAGYACTLAATLEEARMQLAKDRFGAVLCDVMMNGESGLGLIADARRLAPGVPVLIVSALKDDSLAHQARQLGAAGYIFKPFSHGEVLDGVATALRGRATAGAA